VTRVGRPRPDQLVQNQIIVRQVAADEDLVGPLADILVDCVEGGASVGFMLPMGRERAEAFWRTTLQSADRGERIVLVAEVAGRVVGTVQVVLEAPENQPHRGELVKLQVHRRARRHGVAEMLLREAEAAARRAGKTLLVLDTASVEAGRLYARLGWQRVGVIPGYALWPAGGLVDTAIYYKALTGS
jgi:ribosomal protein S18 acetylase RimI-like enzyme